MATPKKTTAAKRPQRITLRSYDVGFGDCYLLSFHYPGFDRHLLIDFGSTRLPPGKSEKNYLLKIAQQIALDCEGKLHAVIATHRHKDHISGFTTSQGKGPGQIIRDLKPDLVIQPWTEDEHAARDARGPTRTAAGQRRAAHVRMLEDMNHFAGYVVSVSKRLRQKDLQAVKAQLEFLGDDNELANRDAVKNLMTMGKKRRYVYFGAKSGLESILPGVTTRVLGPPTLEQSNTIAKQRSSDKDQFWHLQAARQGFWSKRAAVAKAALAGGQAAQPPSLFPEYQDKRPPWDARWYRYHAQREHADGLLSIVRVLDNQMNNTSVILLFEVGDKTLLFPGDAQYENWMYALEQDGVAKSLAKVNVYKVGHHGSLNATPKKLWNGFENLGGKSAKNRLMSFLSTRDHVHGSEDAGTEVPRSTLVTALQENSALQDTRTLAADELSIVRTFDVNW